MEVAQGAGTRTVAKNVVVKSPTYQFGDYQGWEFFITPWPQQSPQDENSAAIPEQLPQDGVPVVAPEIIRSYAEELFSARLETSTISSDGQIVLKIRKSEKAGSDTHSIIAAYLCWLIVPACLQTTR